jgi:hypothetical protein
MARFRWCATVILIFTSVLTVSAQFGPPEGNQIQAGGGVIWIDNRPFYSFRIRPEVAFGSIGIGLDLNLEFDSSGSLRKENFNEFSDYLSIIRYIRYGKETDQLYFKLGALDYVTLGHGSIINNYNNSPSFDSRHAGLQLNVNAPEWGLQSIYGTFGQASVAGLRSFVRPLRFTSLADIPLLNELEVGVTYSADFNDHATVVKRDSCPSCSGAVAKLGYFGAGTLSILGADIGMPVVRGDFAGAELYADFTKIIDFGGGVAVGVIVHIDGIPLVNFRGRLERRFNGERYIPGYFGPLYEIERWNEITSSAKSLTLNRLTTSSKGVYGDLLMRVINTFDIFGSYERLDGVPASGNFHLWTELFPRESPIVARAGYDKAAIRDFTDLFTTDDRALLYAELGYKPYPFLIVSAVYRWTYTPIRSGDEIIGYAHQRKVEPRVEFIIAF